ncbi:MAG: DUF4845 domain-containing protein [Sulfuritalea sp.]|nr:DUF4845 domain-containing protein [Sulfuritalea sp.]
MKHQRGLSLNGLVLGGAALGLIGLLAMKALPPWMEYGNIAKHVKATASDSSLKSVTVAQVRSAFDRRSSIDNVTSVTGADLDITKDEGELVISFAYTSKVPLFGNTSLIFEFEGSSSAK